MSSRFTCITKIKKYLLLVLGFLALGLGILGIFLPLLPTTPFFLLTAVCFIRSSKRLYTWLITHRLFGIYIYNYITYGAVTRRTKIFALIYLWIALGLSMLLIEPLPIRAILFIIGLCVTIHILWLKTMGPN